MILECVLAGLMLSVEPTIRTVVTHVPPPGEAQNPARLRLDPARFVAEMTLRRVTPRYTVWAVRFPSPVVTPDLANNTVHAEWFLPRTPGRHPGAVVLHILGADFALSRFFAARLAQEGVAALFIKLPYYGERRAGGRRLLTNDLSRSLAAFGQGVGDVRRAAAWLRSRPEVDPARVGATGISLGGIVSALAAGLDPQIDRAALVLAGGGLGEILWGMPEAAGYRSLWRLLGRTRDDLIALTRPVDPLTYAAGLRGKPVLMLNGNVDEVIPPGASVALWEAAGRPPIEWFDCGHYSAVGYLLSAVRKTVAFLAAPDPVAVPVP